MFMFIMFKSFVLIFVILPSGFGESDKKGSNYEYVNEAGYYYRLNREPKTWHEAKEICTEEGATLFYPRTKKEINDVRAHFNLTAYIWIGELRRKDSKLFETVEGVLLNTGVYRNWGKWNGGQPDNDGGKENCVQLRVNNESIWNDLVCTEKQPFICKKTASSCKSGPVSDPHWVMKEEKFDVKCDALTNRTCLILEHDDSQWIDDTKIFVGNSQKGLWLSKAGFDLDRFYTISRNHLLWLKAQSTSVRQVVRVYYTDAFDSLGLRMLNAQDILFDQSPSAVTPMFYTVQRYDGASVAAGGAPWRYADLTVEDAARRLPVEDFFVAHAQPAYVSVQLRELCFA